MVLNMNLTGIQKIRLTGIEKLTYVTIVVSLALAFVNTIWAVYMDSFIQNIVWVGFFSAILTLIAFVSYFVSIPLIEKLDKTKIYSFSLLLFAITYILFAINSKLYIFVIFAFILSILNTFKTTSFGILIREKSSKKLFSRNEGFVYTFTNISWVLGPLLAGYISNKYSINLIFILSAIFILIGLFLFRISKIKDTNTKKKTDSNVLKNFFDFFKDKDRVKAYILSGGIDMWWVLTYLFIPLLIIRNNLSILWVGYFLFAIAVPLILLEYKSSKLAGKIGFKTLFKIGFLIPCIFAFICFFVTNIYWILALLILASFGIALTEPTTEAYFFDISSKKEMLRFYGPYNTTIIVSDFFGKIIASTILIFFPFKFIFLFFSIYMLLMFFLSFKLKEVIESKKPVEKKK